jgi:hypothetical protein
MAVALSTPTPYSHEGGNMGRMGRTVGAAIGALLVVIFFATVAARIHHTSSSVSSQGIISQR